MLCYDTVHNFRLVIINMYIVFCAFAVIQCCLLEVGVMFWVYM